MEEKKDNKMLKVIRIAAAVVIAAGLIWFGRTQYVSKYKITTIDAAVSADGKYELVFQSIGEADWPFGASHAGLVLKHNGKKLAEYRFDIANDGKNLCADNWQVSWKESSVEVRISGEEQKDAQYSLSFDGNVKEMGESGQPIK